MKESLWRRRVFLFVAYTAVFVAASTIPTEIWGQFLWLPLIFSPTAALIIVWVEEKTVTKRTWRLLETVSIQGEKTSLDNRFRSHLAAMTFFVLPHDPAHKPAPKNLRMTVLYCLAYVVFLLIFRLLFRNFYFDSVEPLAWLIPLLAFTLYSFFWTTRRVTFNDAGITVHARRRKPALIAWSDVTKIELWKTPESRFNNSTYAALVMRDADGSALICLQSMVIDEYEERKFLTYLRTAAPTASTREVAKMS